MALNLLPTRQDGYLIDGYGVELVAISTGGWPSTPTLTAGADYAPASVVGEVATWSLTPTQAAAVKASTTNSVAALYAITVGTGDLKRPVCTGELKFAKQGQGRGSTVGPVTLVIGPPGLADDPSMTAVADDPASAFRASLSSTYETKGVVAAAVDDVNAISYARQTATVRNLVSFYFDDALATDLTNIKPIADAKGIPITIAAIANSVDTDPAVLTSAQLLQLQSEGWQIDSHTLTHATLAALTDAQLETELKQSRDKLRAMGLTVEVVTYPYGSFNARVKKIASKYYRAGLQSITPTTNVVPIRSYEIRRVHMKDYTLADMKARVDALNGGWIIFYGHSSPNWLQADIDKFTDLIDYVQAKPIDIVTVSTALDVFENKMEIVDVGTGAPKFTIGPDGVARGPQMDALNHVYLAPTGITDTTPITAFEQFKVTTVAFTSASGSGISLGNNGAGTLITYRICADDVLNFQMFIPWHATAQAMSFRYWTGSAWGAWVTHALAGMFTRNTTMNAYPSTAGNVDFPQGVTMWDFNSSSPGWPVTTGTMMMYRSAQGWEWSYQICEAYRGAARYKRWMTDATTWTAWVDASLATIVNTPRAWIDVATGVGFQNSYVNSTGKTTKFRLSVDGKHVEISGGVSGGTGGLVAFTLPAGYAPLTPKMFVVSNATAGGFLTALVAASGAVTIYGGAAGNERIFDAVFPRDL